MINTFLEEIVRNQDELERIRDNNIETSQRCEISLKGHNENLKSAMCQVG